MPTKSQMPKRLRKPRTRKPIVTSPDDFDHKKYVLRVANPFWLNPLAAETLGYFEMEGFTAINLEVNEDSKKLRFHMLAGRHRQFANTEGAKRDLLRLLRPAGYRVGTDDLVLSITGDVWEGTFTSHPKQDPDDFDPMDYINPAPRNPLA